MNPTSREHYLHRAMIQQLEDLSRSGIGQLPVGTPWVTSPPPAGPPLTAASAPAGVAADAPPAGSAGGSPAREAVNQETVEESAMNRSRKPQPTKPAADAASPVRANARGPSVKQRENQLYVLSKDVAKCTLCDELCAERTQTVFGVGNAMARLCFFGEAPGADEDRQGEPFVGRAGQLLDRIIAACTLKREDVYILNTVKCRPPGNRNPKPEEIANCRPYFERQLEIIQPEFICCLGSVAASTLLETTESIGRLRGRFHTWRSAQVIATYHPAYLLRNPAAKAEVWKDMQLLMKEMGIPLPQTPSRKGS